MNAVLELERSQRAARSARELLASADLEGAANRAYYAMFHAARAALTKKNVEVTTRKHGTLVGLFSLHLVKSGAVPKPLGQAFNEAQRLRQLADYGPSSPVREDAESTVRAAEEFVATIERLLRET